MTTRSREAVFFQEYVLPLEQLAQDNNRMETRQLASQIKRSLSYTQPEVKPHVDAFLEMIVGHTCMWEHITDGNTKRYQLLLPSDDVDRYKFLVLQLQKIYAILNEDYGLAGKLRNQQYIFMQNHDFRVA